MKRDGFDNWFLWEGDAAQFARDVCKWIPDPVQATILTTQAPEVLLLCCRQWGKTTTFAIKADHHTIFRPNSLALVVSATQRQAGILQSRALYYVRQANRFHKEWRTIKEVELPEDPLDENSRLVRQSVLSLELANGSEIVSAPASPDTIRGYSPTLILVDEAARVGESVHYAISPMRSYTHAQLLLGSSAAGQRGYFYEQWKKEDSGWLRLSVKAAECPRHTAEFLKREREKLPLAMYQQEYENEFLSPEGSLFNPDDLARARADGREIPSFLGQHGQRDPDIRPFLRRKE